MKKSMIEVAYQVLTNNDGAMPFVDLWKDVSQEMGFSQTQFEDNIAQFYTDLSLDGRFLNMSQNTWDLRSRHTYSESVMDTDSIAIDEDDDEEEESEIVEDGLDEVEKEMEEKLKVTEYEISVALDSLKEPVSMYEPIYNDGGDTIYLYDQIAVKEDEYGLDNRLALDRAMKNLKKRELNILKDRFIVGKTQMEIAEELGISQAQISRIEKNAINTIKKNIK